MDQSNGSNNQSSPKLPVVSLPKGGGAIQGIGEKFAANPVTGTGAMTIPIATSPGRSGFEPQLALAHDSGSGNGPFGFGWSLSLPAITRKTDKGLPKYFDREESDVYLISGAEDLVPVLDAGSSRYEDATTVPGITIHRYRPRIEGLFARIERWMNQATGEIHWRSISRDNVTTLYGKTSESRIVDPRDARRVFSWLICESYDDKGNATVYEYAGENGANLDQKSLNEHNRVRTANRYVKRIKYGNRTSRLVQPDLTQIEWMFEVVFDYHEHHYEELELDAARPAAEQHQLIRASAATSITPTWSMRPDPFSSHRAGFEVRTYRRCRRILVFHRFAELGAEPYLVRSTEFDYADLDYSSPIPIEDELKHQGSTRFASFIRAVTQSGFVRDNDRPPVENNGVTYLTYIKKSLPPLEFEYSKAQIHDEIRELDAASLENLPAGLNGSSYQWVDLNGEGLTGVLTEQAGVWFYKPNLGDGNFGPLEPVASTPSLADLRGGIQQLIDLSGDGQLDLATFRGSTPGFYERTQDDEWEEFKPFASLPSISWDEPNLRFVDLDGDGHADILITEDEVFTWYPSLEEDGFDSARHVRQSVDEEVGPRLVLDDGTQSIYLADMCGDGLTDLVRIRNGEVCYWPNLGYGCFGAKVAMDNAPYFDSPNEFNHECLRLADIDGSGVNDIIYLGRDGVRLYFNQSGNSWSEARSLDQFGQTDNMASVMTADLMGNGTACLVWSSPLPADVRRPLRYIDLMGGQKPHLLIKSVNNLGAETHINYAASTKFYVADKLDGKPWVTKIPFPVHVVERVETHDRISGNRFVSRSAYHHGYFDGREREFRGFGLVEQWDTEEFAALDSDQQFPVATNVEAASHVPPVLTRTWFHTGAYLDREHVSNFFAGLVDGNDVGEYYREPGLTDPQARELLLDDTVLPDGLTPEEEREAYRALKGSMLRQEVYALDGTDKEPHPYTVTEQNFAVKRLQPRNGDHPAVFFTHLRETINYQYERNPSDPRIAHALTLEVDAFGNVLKSAAVGYGRTQSDSDLAPGDQSKQSELLITYAENQVTNTVDTAADYLTPLPWESRTFQLTGLLLPAAQKRFTPADVLTAATGAAILSYEEKPTNAVIQKRLIACERKLYRANDFTGALPPGQLQSLALPYESYELALTRGLVTSVYGDRVTDAMLESDGTYVHSDDDDWWIPSGLTFYSPVPTDTADQELAYARSHFFVPLRYRDPFHTGTVSTETAVTYDAYDLLLIETRDALNNRVTTGERDPEGNLTVNGNDYRVLKPTLVMDANRNRAAVAIDALGVVVGTAASGKPEDNPPRGDRLDSGFQTELTRSELDQFYADPKGAISATLLGQAGTRLIYDAWTYRQNDPPRPIFSALLARETHSSDPVPADGLKIQVSFSYVDGFGREIQKKLPAENGPVPQRDPNGTIIVGPDGQPILTGNASPRFIGSGWTVFNNKGKPVRQFEPFFTDTHHFEADVRIGISPVIFYDPLQRVVATLHPNHSWEKSVFDPWRQVSWDVNDTVLAADPAADPDVGNYFRRLRETEYLPTWHGRRVAGDLGAAEQAAAAKSSIHAETPAIAHADSLGRTFLTVAHNRFKYSDTPAEDPPVNEFYSTRIEMDIEGNALQLTDAKSRVAETSDYSLLGKRIHQSNMDAGERWTLVDITGKTIFAFDNRNHVFRNTFDSLRRPTESFMRENAGKEALVERLVYGESRANPETGNLRTRLVQHFDQAGVVTSENYDFKGNSLSSKRELAAEYKSTLDWTATVALETTAYISHTSYDALNRPTELISPDNTALRPIYNEGNQLKRVEANLRGAGTVTVLVSNIVYDAKEQRTSITQGNGVETTYDYDPLTLRLIHLTTSRNPVDFPDDCPPQPPADWPGCQVQNLSYTYDPAGHITHIRDDAQQTIYFRNSRVDPGVEYTYDALYRLIEATGREHLGQAGGSPAAHSHNDKPRVNILLSAGDGNAMGRFLERYRYDASGNIEQMIHRGSTPVNPGWTRSFHHDEPSLIEPNLRSNRLSQTTIGSTIETYSNNGDGYTPHGAMTRMPHLQSMQWDFLDQLQMIQRQVVNPLDEEEVQRHGERTWYVYNSDGERVRKVTERENGRIKDERIYLGVFEIFRRHGAAPLTRETLHVMDDKRRIALVETRTQGAEPGVPEQLIRYQCGNHLGTVTLELDDQARIIFYEEYTPFGSTAYQAVRSQTETPRRYGFIGKERDDETGLYYHGARYYAPWLARWTAADPAGMADGPNLFAYCRNRPSTLADPNGMQSTDLPEPSVLDSVDRALTKKGLPYNTEVTVKITLPDGTVVIRRYDRLYQLPDGTWVPVESKGKKPHKLTAAQELADKWVQEKGGKFEVVKTAGKPPGTSKVAKIPLKPGDIGAIKPGHLEYMHGKAGPATPAPNKPNMLHIDVWLEGLNQKIPDVTPPPNSALKTSPHAPPTYVPQKQVLDDLKKYNKPKVKIDIGDAANRPLKPPTEKLKGGLKAVAPMAVGFGFQYFRDKNYQEAAELRAGYEGPVTDEMINRQRRAGWEFTGEYDDENRPKWEYRPGGALRAREGILWLLNMDYSKPIGDEHAQPPPDPWCPSGGPCA